jgi:hypothetical protein
MWLVFLMLLLCLGYVAPISVSLAFTLWCFYGFKYAIACACLYGTSMLTSMIYLLSTILGLSLLATNSHPSFFQSFLAAHVEKWPWKPKVRHGFDMAGEKLDMPFWDCAIAQAVRTEVQRGLGALLQQWHLFG